MIDYFDQVNIIITVISLLIVLINFIINLKSKEESNAVSTASLVVAILAFISLFLSEGWGFLLLPVSWLLLLYSKNIPSLEKYESSIVWQFRIIILLPIFLTLILVAIFIGAITLLPEVITDTNNLIYWSAFSEIPSSVIIFLVLVVLLTIFMSINKTAKKRIKESIKMSKTLSEEKKEEMEGYYDAVNNYNAMLAWGA